MTARVTEPPDEPIRIARYDPEWPAEFEYLHAPYLPEEMCWFCKPDPGRRTHHLRALAEAAA